MARVADPSLNRRTLGRELRKARETSGLTQREAAQDLDWSLSKLIRIETGQVSLSVTGLQSMMGLYSITDQELVEDLTQAARGSKGVNWWTRYSDVLTKPLALYLGFESAAAALRSYHPIVVPEHLQTRAYATALLQPRVEPTRRDRLAALCGERQERFFDQDGSVRASFVVDELALRRQIGSPAVMRQQLEHLTDLSARPRVDISVLRHDSGAHYSTQGSFVLLDMTDNDTLLYMERVGSLTSGNDSDLASFQDCFETIRAAAVRGDAATELIDQIKEEITSLDSSEMGGYATRAAQIAATSRRRAQGTPAHSARRHSDSATEQGQAQPLHPQSPGPTARPA